MIYLREMSSGDLLADPGGPVPEVPAGYARDPAVPHRLHLVPRPAACASRSEKKCLVGKQVRLWCTAKGLVNPGVCCRCQKLVTPFANPMEV